MTEATLPYAEVIGDPIAHSKSPLIHQFWLKKLGIHAEYRRSRISPEDLSQWLQQRRSDPLWRGANLTIPHKEKILPLVEDPEGLAASVGAMNIVVPGVQGSPCGFNSDVDGFAEPLDNVDLKGKCAALYGAGGAARAVLFALKQMGIAHVTILNRSEDRAQALLDQFDMAGQVLPLLAPLPSVQLVVNSTALGMTGYDSLRPDLSTLPSEAIIYDIVYSPLETELLSEANGRGLRTLDGLNMLIGQAAKAFQLFFGADAPRDHDFELRVLLAA
ncbi:shikimate dehydrogenase [Rhizorhapis suberifaciens]|uniref:Shikimate dehydrogenase (NADP(+)) n=1 Tax=Rhizorhapis suberifaciens TaxID=13656 RepID=A0A840HTF9_9SPHN|nr:shikimate dehydrogenase [Rhizorhapis suberifaciens]MBB4640784.1 shikimate dehydrogenase [Rhizorhapis suberifaciens]